MNRDRVRGERFRNGAEGWGVGGNTSAPSPQPPQSDHHAASTPAIQPRQMKQQQQQQPSVRAQQSDALPHHHSGSGTQHRRFVSGVVSTPPAQAVRTTALRPTQRSTLAGSMASARTVGGGGWRGGGGSNESMTLQIQQAQMQGAQQFSSPPISRYSATVQQRPQQQPQQRQQQTVYKYQHDAMPQRNSRDQIRIQRRQQEGQHQRPPRQQQLPRQFKSWSSNFGGGSRGQQDRAPRFADRSNRAGQVDQDVHYGREVELYPNDLLSGNQARVNHAMRRNIRGSEGQEREGGSSTGDGAREHKKRRRGEEPESSAGDDSSGKGGGGGNTKRSKASRREAVEGEPLRSPSRSASQPHHSKQDHAGALFAATPESPDLSQPRVLYADSISPNVPEAFRVGPEVPHQRAANPGAPTPGGAVALGTGRAAAAATNVSVENKFLPGPPLLCLRLSAAGGTPELNSSPSPRQSPSGSVPKKKKKKKKKKPEQASGHAVGVGSGSSRADDDSKKFGGGPPEFLPKTTSQPIPPPLTPSAVDLDEEIPPCRGADVTVSASAASSQGVTAAGRVLNLSSASPGSASTGSTLADQLYFAAAQAKVKALQLRKEASKAYRQATKAARLAEVELKHAEARVARGATSAATATGQIADVNALPSFAAFLEDHEEEKDGNYAVSDYSDSGELCEETGSPGYEVARPMERVNPSVNHFPRELSAGGGSPKGGNAEEGGTPAPLEKKEDKRAPSPTPVASRYNVSSSEESYADTDFACGASPRGDNNGNAEKGGTPAAAMDEKKYEKTPIVPLPVTSRYNVSSSEDGGEASSEDEVPEGEGGGQREMQVSRWGRYDVSSSSSALSDVEDSDDGFDRNNNFNNQRAPGVALLQSPPLPQPCSPPRARHDVSSTSSAAPTTPAASPHSSPSGRYDVSSSDNNDDGARQQQQQQRRLQHNQKRRMQRKRRQGSSSSNKKSPPPGMDMQPSPERMLSSSSEACSDDDGSGFDSEEYKRFFEPKLLGSGGDRSRSGGSGGLGLPHPLGLKIVQGGGAGNGTGEYRSSSGVGDESQLNLEIGPAPPNDDVLRPAGSGAEKARLPHKVSVVVPSSADFKWEKVNLKDPLSSHKSLLDRLAGIGSPLPNFSGMPPPVREPRSVSPSAAASPATVAGAALVAAPLDASEAPIPESPTPMEEAGNPGPVGLGPPKGRSEDSQSSSSGQQAVLDVNRESGNQHWGALINAENMPPIELDPAKRPRVDGGERKPSGGGSAGGGGVGSGGEDPGGSRDQPPLPMRDDPSVSGKKVVDQEAYARMYPGGAVVTMKGFSLKDKSAVSAAFELCATMEPKSRPKFENKDSGKSVASPFTIHVSVNGVNYTPATAKSVKLAKQLASINFLREVVGTREHHFSLKDLSTEAGGGAAALAAAVGKGKGKGKDGEDDDSGSVTCDAEAARLALDDGLPNHAQLLHDLAAAHAETPSFATYAYRNIKDPSMTVRGKAFRCTARLIRHSIDAAEVDRRREKEKEAMAAEEAARSALATDPTNKQLLEEMKKARAMIDRARTTPVLTIGMINAVGNGASKKEAKHKAAEALAYVLLPECKTDAELRKKTKKIIDVYQKEKKERMEEEQRIAQEAKALREKAEAAVAAAASGTTEEAMAAKAAADSAAHAAAQAYEQRSVNYDRSLQTAVEAAKQAAEKQTPAEDDGADATADGDVGERGVPGGEEIWQTAGVANDRAAATAAAASALVELASAGSPRPSGATPASGSPLGPA